MSIRVTLNVFSGKQNPTWILTDAEEVDLLNRLERVRDFTREKPSGVLGLLGYRGFSLSRPLAAPHGPLALYVHDGIVDRGQEEENLQTGDRKLEDWLLDTAPATLSASVRRHVEDQLSAAPVQTAAYVANRAVPEVCPVCAAADAPMYQPNLWNVPAIQPHNNCYNYANDQVTNTFAQPGLAHGAQTSTMACPNVNAAAQADGLVDAPGFSGHLGVGSGWYVALVIWPGNDYHWYRQDNVGCWSHKPGSTAVRDVDQAGSKISDPATCNRGPYANFCGYMITKKSNVIH